MAGTYTRWYREGTVTLTKNWTFMEGAYRLSTTAQTYGTYPASFFVLLR
ncbi:MAG: hypothetical protein IJP86_05490 [Synergistaceae bacterium]|nr:hypothetical protein [Synergistaceae bacterium]